MAHCALFSVCFLLVTSVKYIASQQFVFDNRVSDGGGGGGGGEFSCAGRAGGYYADLSAGCSSYTLCAPGGRAFQFACPPGTRFRQQVMVCDHAFRVDCQLSPRYFALNELIGRVPIGSAPAEQQKRAAEAETARATTRRTQIIQPRRLFTSQPAVRAPTTPRTTVFRTEVPATPRPVIFRSEPATTPRSAFFSPEVLATPRAVSREPEEAGGVALPRAEVSQALLDLVRLSTRESSRRPAPARDLPRPAPPPSAPAPAPPAVTSILSQVAALGGPPPPQPQPQPSSPQPRLDAGQRLLRLTKSLASAAPAEQAASRQGKSSADGRLRFSPARQGVRRQGWTPAPRRAADTDRRCPGCLASLVVSFDACFPCVSVLR